MMIVDYPPGSVDPIHRHNAHAVVYVLEGSIVMQVRGGKDVTLTPGQTFYEGPDDVHVVGRNASKVGSVQESDRARDFSGVGFPAKRVTLVAVAVGMWKPVFGAGFQALWDERQLSAKILP